MSSETAAEQASEGKPDEPKKKSLGQRAAHEARETLLTVAMFVPFWLIFSTFVYELRSIPSESMVPALQVGDRVAVAKFAYGYDRDSVPFGIGHWFGKDDANNPNERWFGRMPKRGDVIVFQHPHQDRVMIKRLVGLPGDEIQMRAGRLYIKTAGTNDFVMVERTPVREVAYVANDEYKDVVPRVTHATEYSEQLPGEKKPHLIQEFSDSDRLDKTPIFRVPPDHVFMMGDNRDNSEDSRAPTGHRGLAALQPDAWSPGAVDLSADDAIGFVPVDHLIGRAETVLFTLYSCKKAPGAECATGRLWKGL